MEDFDPQLGHLAVITSRGSDTTLLTQALVIIHNDLILHKGVAAREYCSNDLMESLICKFDLHVTLTIIKVKISKFHGI